MDDDDAGATDFHSVRSHDFIKIGFDLVQVRLSAAQFKTLPLKLSLPAVGLRREVKMSLKENTSVYHRRGHTLRTVAYDVFLRTGECSSVS